MKIQIPSYGPKGGAQTCGCAGCRNLAGELPANSEGFATEEELGRGRQIPPQRCRRRRPSLAFPSVGETADFPPGALQIPPTNIAPSATGLFWPFAPNSTIQPGWENRSPRKTHFGAPRPKGRLHAACDLVILRGRGTPVRAIADGEVLDFHGGFAGNTGALVIRHQVPGLQPFIVRYGEVLAPSDLVGSNRGLRWSIGDRVRGGQVIARLGQMPCGSSMLHFELYATGHGLNCGSLSINDRAIATNRWHRDFKRRIDLADPTDFLVAIRAGRLPAQPVPVRPMTTALCDGRSMPVGPPTRPIPQSIPGSSTQPTGQQLAALAQLATGSSQPTEANSLAIVRALAAVYCIPWRIPFAVLEHEGGVRNFRHRDGVMQTTDAVKDDVIRSMPRALKLTLTDLANPATIADAALDRRVRAAFPSRLAVQIACGVQELATQLKTFKGYVALALIAYNTGFGNASNMVKANTPPGGNFEEACRFTASLYHQADGAIRVTSPGQWQCDKNIPAWFKHFAVFDRRLNRQLIGYKYLRGFTGCIARTPPAEVTCNGGTHRKRVLGTGTQHCEASRRGVLEKIYDPSLLGRGYRDALAGSLSPLPKDEMPLVVRNCRLAKMPLASGLVHPVMLGH